MAFAFIYLKVSEKDQTISKINKKLNILNEKMNVDFESRFENLEKKVDNLENQSLKLTESEDTSSKPADEVKCTLFEFVEKEQIHIENPFSQKAFHCKI